MKNKYKTKFIYVYNKRNIKYTKWKRGKYSWKKESK